ncbi:hydroxyacylglutathione hydrolase [Aequitasia blattaphilus]|uniref:MBL fold metallo-hydrolase n=1 Tax=Aequitasia blattaphilus TaxID=2949332 RepID=A0ABT1E6U2_9FIRM|nr:MBL fold metallo-hydrolase [Aequitasia blattaphilus]MCP1101319.1 MBL fold metallo-hydrolase [Aequitasia blattaphilus]MCR8613959.1 MBL fold metallo-hydrolase [Aequitasia blattaphilus]
MKIESFSVGLVGANCYVICNEETKEGVVIDPGGTSKSLLDYLKQDISTVKAILLTHGHFDHIMGIDKIREIYPADVYVYEAEQDFLKDANQNGSMPFVNSGYTYHEAISLNEEEDFEVIGLCFQILHTPGHTPGSCCFYEENEGILFTGDTLFLESIGRTDLAGGSPEIFPSIKKKLLTLPEETVVYPGHMGATTIGHEKKYNHFLR